MLWGICELPRLDYMLLLRVSSFFSWLIKYFMFGLGLVLRYGEFQNEVYF